MTTHEALVQARLDEKHAIAHDALNASRTLERDLTLALGPDVERAITNPNPSLRVRLGHGLVVLGGAIAGDGADDGSRWAA